MPTQDRKIRQERYINNLVLESELYPSVKDRVNIKTGMPPLYERDLVTVREAVMQCVTFEQLKKIMEVQIEKAMQGSDFSAKFIFDRYFGPQITVKHIEKTTNTNTISNTNTNNTVQVVDLAKFTPEQLKQLQEMKKTIEDKTGIEEPEGPEGDE